MKKLALLLLIFLISCSPVKAPTLPLEQQKLEFCEYQKAKLQEDVKNLDSLIVVKDSIIFDLTKTNFDLTLKTDSMARLLKGNVCIPVETARALFKDAKDLPLVKEELLLKNKLITSYEATLLKKDSIIYNLEYQVILQDSIILSIKDQEAPETEMWWKKWIYGAAGFVTGVGVNSLINAFK